MTYPAVIDSLAPAGAAHVSQRCPAGDTSRIGDRLVGR
jgi:hypothetical protein